MKIISEKDEAVVNMDVDFTEKEMNILLNYAQENISLKEFDRMLIEWALIDIIKKDVKQNNLQEEKSNECRT